MATERQIESNRRNAARSTGPKSPQGKARSRVNATKHGLASELVDVEAGLSPEFEKRRAAWAVEQQPVGQEAGWALDRVVAASLRIERCERAVDKHIASVQERAKLTWDEDRGIEAAKIAARLERDPVLASRELGATLAGVALLIDGWLGLVATFQADRDWSESEASKALDLLGVAPDHRANGTPIDAPEEADSIEFRWDLALNELDRLEKFQDEALIPLDAMDRRHALAGDVALLSKPATLLLRYERDAWKRYREAKKELKEYSARAPIPEGPGVKGVASPAVRKAPAPKAKSTSAQPSSSFEEERRALLAEAAPYLKQAIDPLIAMGLTDEDAWLEELERRVASYSPSPRPGTFAPIAAGVRAQPRVTERTRIGGVPSDQGSL
jgi:hypothetical protein